MSGRLKAACSGLQPKGRLSGNNDPDEITAVSDELDSLERGFIEWKFLRVLAERYPDRFAAIADGTCPLDTALGDVGLQGQAWAKRHAEAIRVRVASGSSVQEALSTRTDGRRLRAHIPLVIELHPWRGPGIESPDASWKVYRKKALELVERKLENHRREVQPRFREFRNLEEHMTWTAMHLVEGLTYQNIADAVNGSYKTIGNAVQNVLKALGMARIRGRPRKGKEA